MARACGFEPQWPVLETGILPLYETHVYGAGCKAADSAFQDEAQSTFFASMIRSHRHLFAVCAFLFTTATLSARLQTQNTAARAKRHGKKVANCLCQVFRSFQKCDIIINYNKMTAS